MTMMVSGEWAKWNASLEASHPNREHNCYKFTISHTHIQSMKRGWRELVEEKWNPENVSRAQANEVQSNWITKWNLIKSDKRKFLLDTNGIWKCRFYLISNRCLFIQMIALFFFLLIAFSKLYLLIFIKNEFCWMMLAPRNIYFYSIFMLFTNYIQEDFIHCILFSK